MAVLAQSFDPKASNLFSVDMAVQVLANGTNIPVSGMAFNDTVAKQIFIAFRANFYLSGNLTVTLSWYSEAGNITGSVVWGIQMAALTSGDAQSVLTDALASAQSAASVVNGTARGTRDGTVTVTNLDGLAANDWVQMRIYRDAGVVGDTMAGDAVLTMIDIAYASTSGAGAGNVSNAGGSSDNDICRFDLATGQVIQDSSVNLDDSGNFTNVGLINGIDVDKYATVVELPADVNPASATLANITGLAIALPRAGTYWIEGMVETANSTAIAVAFGLNVSANLTRLSIGWVQAITAGTTASGQQKVSLAVGGAGVASGTRGAAFVGPTTLSGSITVSGAATVQILVMRVSGTLTIGRASAINIREQ